MMIAQEDRKIKNSDIKRYCNESPCLCFNIRKATRAITQIYDNMFRPLGITATQGAIINSVRMLGPLTISQLADAMATDRTTITRNLKPLEREGVIKVKEGEDRRIKRISVTSKGVEISNKSRVVWEKLQTRIYNTVGRDRVEKLCKDMSDVIEQIK